MPTPVLALLLAVLLAAALSAGTPALLRWCPWPDEEVDPETPANAGSPPPGSAAPRRPGLDSPWPGSSGVEPVGRVDALGPRPPVATFCDLATPRFRTAVFWCSAGAAGMAFCLARPTLWLAWAALAGPGVLLALVDLRTTYLPTRLVSLAAAVAAVGAGVAAWTQESVGPLLWAGIGGAGATALFWLLWWASRGRLGFGDVRLAGLIGLVAGATSPHLVSWAIFLGALASALWGVGVRWRRGADGAFPYGPGFLLGPFLALALSWVWQLA